MKKIFRIKYFIFCLLFILCFAGCSRDADVETGNDFVTEAEGYADLSEPSLSELFDDSEELSGEEKSSVVVHKQGNDESTDKAYTDFSPPETKESVAAGESGSDDVLKSEETDSGSIEPFIYAGENSSQIVDKPGVSNDELIDPADEVNNNVEQNEKEENNTGNNGNGITGSGSDVSEEKEEIDPESAAYILNNNTKKFHYPDCGSSKQIKGKNKGYGNDRDAIIAQGYKPCKRCNP